MNKLFIILCLFSLSEIKAQVIHSVDFDGFSEKRMNETMFDQMNKYVKSLHCGDSLIWSSVVQKDIMTDNYNFIKNNDSLLIHFLHNPKWLGKGFNDLPDTIKTKIVNEMSKYPDLAFLKANQLKNTLIYLSFSYTEILGSITFSNEKASFTYESLACMLIREWNESPSHAMYMNADYKNKVIVGVISYYNKEKKTIFVSFVYVS
jgi:hypothetical protein